MKIAVFGGSHLAQTLRRAAEMHGIQVVIDADEAAVVFAAEDVVDHSKLEAARATFDAAVAFRVLREIPLVLVSQVPPGTTAAWAQDYFGIYYQVDTIIMKQALRRMFAPEQLVVGCADPTVPLPLPYQEYLNKHGCPVLQMSYTSAELAKCAINYALAKQIEVANRVQAVARLVDAHAGDVVNVMRNDARIGPFAYLQPGVLNEHLKRDVVTIERLLGDT